MSISELDPWTLAWIGLAMGLVWLMSLLSGDASIVDVFWGPGFVLVAVAAARHEAPGARQALAGGLVTLWALRLAVHLFLRNHGRDEDPRYAAMRRRWGRAFGIVSLYTVFAFQGVVMWIVSLPLQAAMRATSPTALGPLDLLGAAVFAVGFVFEAVGDLQLTRFRSDPANEGEVMDRGLWRYSRHPNYFGDALLWWGLGLIGLATGAWWSLAGPLVMTALLLRVSGVTLLERHMEHTRPDYDDYRERTSAFVPMPPRS